MALNGGKTTLVQDEEKQQLLLEKHTEKHFTAGEVVRDIIIGVSDGLTVPFALVLTAGLAEVAAGAISMGLGGYLAAKSEADHYNRELQREQDEIDTVPDVVTSLRNNPKAWLEFMMKFELGLERPEPRRALVSAATIALSYVAGGLVPLLPYMFVPEAARAMAVSVAVTLAALLFFGFVKGRFTGDRPFFSAVQTTVVGALASAAAFAMARAVQSI
ncbi:Protein CCC1 [Zea mays]|uniref:Vacuolar iron transporter n=1 Tax=Zea mays TaxID=4577 RepID=A0A1D6I3Y1_MAIZE|nr:Protein CCC1 [Zea mays]